jgi:hypothetical protein
MLPVPAMVTFMGFLPRSVMSVVPYAGDAPTAQRLLARDHHVPAGVGPKGATPGLAVVEWGR